MRRKEVVLGDGRTGLKSEGASRLDRTATPFDMKMASSLAGATRDGPVYIIRDMGRFELLICR